MRMTRLAMTVAACLAAGGAASAAEIPVDVELVLAVDMSGSMDATEHAVQRDGYVEALRHPEFLKAVASGAYQRIAITYVEWAGPGTAVTVMPWSLIDGPESAFGFSEELAARPHARIRGTSISGALDYARPLFQANGYEGLRRVIDISGDGPNNRGGPVLPARAAVLADGIIINGLPIMIRPSPSYGGLDRYYTDCVIGGPGAFVLPVTKAEEMAEAIRRKLILEVALRPEPPPAEGEVILAQGAPSVDCTIGERMQRYWMDP